MRLPDSRELLVSDTVGFIDRLPHALVAAFRATLEEVAEADLVLHVIDAAAPDRERRMAAVRQVLEEVGATEVPLIEVYNKCDQLTVDERRRLQERDPAAVCISALNGDGVEELVETMASRLALDVRRITMTFDPDDPADRERIARLYRHARVLVHEARDGQVSIVADVPRRLIGRLEPAEEVKFSVMRTRLACAATGVLRCDGGLRRQDRSPRAGRDDAAHFRTSWSRLFRRARGDRRPRPIRSAPGSFCRRAISRMPTAKSRRR